MLMNTHWQAQQTQQTQQTQQSSWPFSRFDVLVFNFETFKATLASVNLFLTIKDLNITLFEPDDGPPIDRDAIEEGLSAFSIESLEIHVHKLMTPAPTNVESLAIHVHEFMTPVPTNVERFSWESPDFKRLNANQLRDMIRRQRRRKR
jgi:hypothetical protein